MPSAATISLSHSAFGLDALATSRAGSIKPVILLLSAKGTCRTRPTPLKAAFGA